MKYIQEELVSGGDKKRFMFAVGIEEAEILVSLLERAYRFMPTQEKNNLQDARRIQDMVREMKKAIPEIKAYQEFKEKYRQSKS